MPNLALIAKKMIVRSAGDHHDIEHFLKVYAYADLISRQEITDEGTRFVTLASALVHDIACPSLRKKCGSCPHHEQELLGEPLARELLQECKLSEEVADRISHLVGIHHSYDRIDGIDAQILMEADFIVNAQEQVLNASEALRMRKRLFKTHAGIELLNDIFALEP